MRDLESRILERRNELDLTYDTIATKLTAITGKSVSKSTVGAWFTGTGIPIEMLEPLFTILEFKLVCSHEICVPKKEYDALATFAEKGFAALTGARR